ncbi:sensor domain-containing diguanylate cyclase [Neorhizobium sp. JUb45]|uniref:GGDEF domain-containing protein n=1 Tax=unclassified Neorhizobium TaxID=2629175 RepID=UPI0014044740|nr:sensor domain-containing diguanylate cyclase [Neorhizobium sp. JUb45]
MAKRESIASLIPASQDIYRKIVFEIADGIIGIDSHGTIRLCNPAAEAIFGWKPGELLDKPLEVLLPDRLHSFHHKLVSGFEHGAADARYMGQRDANTVGRRADGSEIHCGITILRTEAAGEPMMIAVVRDISDHVRYQNDLKRLAETDSLSGLLNRRAFREQVSGSLIRDAAKTVSVALFDLDGFKSVNDRFGHDAGDEVIVRFSEVLRSTVRADDIVGRWGGEEFILFLPGSAEMAAVVVERVRARFTEIEFHWEGHEPVNLTVSAGIVTTLAGEARLDDMVTCADNGLYEAKRGGRDRLVSVEMERVALAS